MNDFFELRMNKSERKLLFILLIWELRIVNYSPKCFLAFFLYSPKFQVYDPQDDSWSPIAHMMVPRCEFGLVALNNSLFAFGGWVGEDIGGSIEMCDPGRLIFENK